MLCNINTHFIAIGNVWKILLTIYHSLLIFNKLKSSLSTPYHAEARWSCNVFGSKSRASGSLKIILPIKTPSTFYTDGVLFENLIAFNHSKQAWGKLHTFHLIVGHCFTHFGGCSFKIISRTPYRHIYQMKFAIGSRFWCKRVLM